MSLAFPLPKGIRRVTPDYAAAPGQVAFAVPFRFFDPADIFVGVEVLGTAIFVRQVLNVDYTLTGAGLQGGGTITFAVAPITTYGAGALVRVEGRRIPVRTTSVVNDGVLQSQPFENELDAVEMTLQELRRDSDDLLSGALPASIADAVLEATTARDETLAAAAAVESLVLGAYPSDAAVDLAHPGAAAGAIYVNTTLGAMRFRSGGIWQPLPVASAFFTIQNYSPTAGQTVFPVSAGYTPPFCLIFRNSVLMPLGVEATATNGTSFTLNTPAKAGDDVSFMAFNTFAVGNALVPGNNLADVANPDTARNNLGIDAIAFHCRLVLNGSNLELQRAGGRRLWIGARPEIIPVTPPSLSATGLTPGTLYFIYSFMNSGVMALEASTTVPVADATYGHQIKTGDNSRTLVGMGQPITGPAWVSSEAQRLVLSFHNRRDLNLRNNFTANRLVSFTTYGEVNTEIRCQFLTWGEDAVPSYLTGIGTNSASNGQVGAGFSLDGVILYGASSPNQVATGGISIARSFAIPAPSRGFHFLTVVGYASSTTNTTYFGGTAGNDNVCTLTASTKG